MYFCICVSYGHVHIVSEKIENFWGEKLLNMRMWQIETGKKKKKKKNKKERK